MENQSDLSREKIIQAKMPEAETGIEIKKSICAVCFAHCGVNAHVRDGRLIKVEGTKEYPTNAGKLCGKGMSNLQYVYHPERIQTPLIRKGPKGSGEYLPVSWDEALDRIVSGLTKIKEETGPESVVFFSGYPKWLRPFLKRMAHSFGSPNYCTESSTCFLATTVAHQLNYGYGGAGFDFKGAKCILNWSMNPFNSATHLVPRFLKALENGVKLIDVGPLDTPLSRKADIHLKLRPGTSGALALGMANVMIEERLFDREFVENWTLGFEAYRAYVEGFSPEVTEGITGVPADKIIAAARLYATSKPAAMVNSASTTVHHTNGVQNHRAITALIGLTGNFDRRGGNHVVPASYYHTPTGLTTREREFEQSRPWEDMAPRIGQDRHPLWCKLTTEAQSTVLPFQIQSGKPYPIKAVLGFGLNYRMWPGSDFIKESLEKLDFFVDVDLFMTDSAKLADVVLPACSSFERNQLVITPARYALWNEPVIPPVGESRSDAEIILALSQRLNPQDTLMSQGYEACLDWIFEPSHIKMADIKQHPGGFFLPDRTETPYEKYRVSGFPTPSGKMEFTSTLLKEAGMDPLPVYKEPEQSPVSAPEMAKEYPLILTTGSRLPMLMHSRMYRIPSTRKLHPHPTVDINPQDALVRGILPDEWVTLVTPRASLRVKANITEVVPPGVTGMYHGCPSADVNRLIDPDYRDPISGFPGYKSLLCEVKKIQDQGGDR